MYILNEKEYIKNILTSNQKPDELSIRYLITLIAKYYFHNTTDAETLSALVKKKLAEFAIDNYQEYTYHKRIMTTCEGLFNESIDYRLKEREFVPIYMDEINLIHSLPDDRQKKVMFTLYAVARYMECGGWVNKKDAKGLSEIFKLANVTLPCAKRNELLHELYRKGTISFGKKIDNLNIQVELSDAGEIAYKIREFQNIGNQYIAHFKKGYKQCKRCGRIIKRTGTNKQYCNVCSKEAGAANNIKRIRKCRENKN
ncbi:MAG: hypothetical protein HFH14_08585 [Lachnospiraceae bacterium]|nr:hypothetical protein [Lachnospiraceae bacterium]